MELTEDDDEDESEQQSQHGTLRPESTQLPLLHSPLPRRYQLLLLRRSSKPQVPGPLPGPSSPSYLIFVREESRSESNLFNVLLVSIGEVLQYLRR